MPICYHLLGRLSQMKKLSALLIVFLMIFSTLWGCTVEFEITEEYERFIGTWISIPSNNTILTFIIKEDISADLRLNACDSEGNLQEELFSASGYWSAVGKTIYFNYADNPSNNAITFQINPDTIETKWSEGYWLHKES